MYTTGKNIQHVFLILLLLASIVLMGLCSPVSAPPSTTIVSLDPMQLVVPNVGQNFTINVNLANIADLGAWEFKLGFNASLIKASYVHSTPDTANNTDWVPIDGGTFHPNAYPTIDETNGIVWVGALVPTTTIGTGIYGNVTLVIINFTATAPGNSTLHIYDVVLGDAIGHTITDFVTLDGSITVLPKIGDFHTHHINDPDQIGKLPRDYAPYVPMVIPVNGENVTIAPFITCTTFEDNVFKPNFHPCKLAQTNLTDNDWSDGDANYTYAFEDWTDYDWNDIVVSLYAVTNNLIINAENFLESREAAWKNPFGVEITPIGMTVEVHWNSTDYPEAHIVTVNPGDTKDIDLFAESIPGKTAFITIIPMIPPTASFDYLPPEPEENQTVTFDASASTANVGTIISYTWNFGDGEFGIGKIVTHTYATAGNFTVSLNVTNSVGKWDVTSKQITVKPKPLPQPVGGHAVPINISIETSNSLVPRIGLALLGTIAVTIILIRHRKRH